MWWWPGFREAWQGRVGIGWCAAMVWCLALAAAIRATATGAPLGVTLGLWCPVLAASLVNGWRLRARTHGGGPAGDDDIEVLFLAARSEYLKGQWFQTQQLLDRLLHRQPEHFAGLLLRATLMRRMERWDDAEATLRGLEVLPDAEQWRLEIDRERQAVITGRGSCGEREAA